MPFTTTMAEHILDVTLTKTGLWRSHSSSYLLVEDGQAFADDGKLGPVVEEHGGELQEKQTCLIKHDHASCKMQTPGTTVAFGL